jgi:RNA polymerase sigma-70 factor, ECF subfamily
VDVLEVYRRGCEARPDVVLSLERFTAHFDDARSEPSDAGELLLAAACAEQDAAALEIFDREYVTPNRGLVVQQLGGDEARADDVLQEARCALLLPPDTAQGPGAIPLLRYAGEGKLRGLVRTVLRRACIKCRARATATVEVLTGVVESAAGLADLHAGPGPRAATQRAVAEAWRLLPAPERLLLQLHHIKGLPVRRLAAVYGIHAATAARRVAAARLELARLLREVLTALDPERAEALHPEFESRLSLSFMRAGLDEEPPSNP